MNAEWIAAIAAALTVVIAIIQGIYMWRQEDIRKKEYFQAKLARVLELTIEYPILKTQHSPKAGLKRKMLLMTK